MKFKVMGQRAQVFYVDVEATNQIEAYDVAMAMDTTSWTEIETDNIIEAVEILEVVEHD